MPTLHMVRRWTLRRKVQRMQKLVNQRMVVERQIRATQQENDEIVCQCMRLDPASSDIIELLLGKARNEKVIIDLRQEACVLATKLERIQL